MRCWITVNAKEKKKVAAPPRSLWFFLSGSVVRGPYHVFRLRVSRQSDHRTLRCRSSGVFHGRNEHTGYTTDQASCVVHHISAVLGLRFCALEAAPAPLRVVVRWFGEHRSLRAECRTRFVSFCHECAHSHNNNEQRHALHEQPNMSHCSYRKHTFGSVPLRRAGTPLRRAACWFERASTTCSRCHAALVAAIRNADS